MPPPWKKSLERPWVPGISEKRYSNDKFSHFVLDEVTYIIKQFFLSVIVPLPASKFFSWNSKLKNTKSYNCWLTTDVWGIKKNIQQWGQHINVQIDML